MTIYDEFYQKTKDYTRNELIIELIKKYSEKQELIDYLKEQINYIKNNFSQVNGNYFMLNDKLETYEDILSKIEKE